MNSYNLLKSNLESITVNLGIAQLKILLERKEKKFFLKWISDDAFIMSLNFSVGTNYVFDLNDDAKSAVIAYGYISQMSENKTVIKIETKFKYGLLLILLIPILMLILDLTIRLSIPVPFYFVFPLAFLLILVFFRNEEKKLIENFKDYLNV